MSTEASKMLALMVYQPSWQYYVKYKNYLKELGHPFAARIDFYEDQSLSIDADILRRYKAVAFFYHDPLRQLYPEIYRYAKKVEAICKDMGIIFLNTPDSLSDSVKSIQLAKLASGGFVVAPAYPFQSWEELLINENVRYPIFIRYNSGHDSLGEAYTEPFYSNRELKESRIWESDKWKKKEHFEGMVALKWIDTKKGDGFYRKYRVFVFGKTVMRGPLRISQSWYVHGNTNIKNDTFRKEQNDFTSGIPTESEREFFVRVNDTLGLDFSAIDYSFDRKNNIIVWEANPHPSLGDWVEGSVFKKNFTNALSDFYFSKLS